MGAVASRLRNEILGVVAVRVASMEAKWGSLGGDLQVAKAELSARLEKLEQLAPRALALEESAKLGLGPRVVALEIEAKKSALEVKAIAQKQEAAVNLARVLNDRKDAPPSPDRCLNGASTVPPPMAALAWMESPLQRGGSRELKIVANNKDGAQQQDQRCPEGTPNVPPPVSAFPVHQDQRRQCGPTKAVPSITSPPPLRRGSSPGDRGRERVQGRASPKAVPLAREGASAVMPFHLNLTASPLVNRPSSSPRERGHELAKPPSSTDLAAMDATRPPSAGDAHLLRRLSAQRVRGDPTAKQPLSDVARQQVSSPQRAVTLTSRDGLGASSGLPLPQRPAQVVVPSVPSFVAGRDPSPRGPAPAHAPAAVCASQPRAWLWRLG